MFPPELLYYFRMQTVFGSTFLALLVAGAAFAQTTGQCPEITLIGPAGITMPGDDLVFRAHISGSNMARLSYEWTITSGTITAGQATEQIRVATTRENRNTTITATVTVTGLTGNCPNTAEMATDIGSTQTCDGPADEYGPARWPDEKARLSSLALVMNANPESTGVVYMRLGSSEKIEAAKKHAQKIQKFMRMIDSQTAMRLTFMINKTESQHSTRLYVVPVGAALPPCEGECTILDGKDLP